jgi:hypothetical protein
VIRHLVGGGPERRDVLTECSLSAAIPGSLVTDLELVTCLECRASLVTRGICRECGSGPLVWGHAPMSQSGVPDGRLRAGDVVSGFYLGCEACSATVLSRVHPDLVAAALTTSGWRP